MESAERLEIDALMQRYFDGLYHSDSAVLRTVFHKYLSYVNAISSDHEFLGLEAYMDRIDARIPPASRNDPREEIVERVTLKFGKIGLVEARMVMLGKDYQDLLTLIHTEDGWRVLTKVFTLTDREV